MFKYILAIALMIPSLCSAYTFQDAQQIYYNLVQSNHITDAPRFGLYKTDSINAYTIESGKGYIAVTRGLLEKGVNNKDELALIIAHELGHWHNRATEKPFYQEYAADRYGYFAAKRAGYNACLGAKWFARVAPQGGKTHPPGTARTYVLLLRCH